MAGQEQPSVLETFTAFFEGWVVHQQVLLQRLVGLSDSIDGINRDDECRDLVAQVLAHYRCFYEEKKKAATEDVFLFFSQPWLSSFERTLLWISGFKPSMVFRLLTKSVQDLSAEQAEKLERIKGQTRREEREIDTAYARVQESVAEPLVYTLITRVGRLVDGEVSRLEAAMDELKASMLAVMENADGLRGRTVTKVVEILNPLQTVKFLIAAGQFQLQSRRWGLQRDARVVP